MPFRLEMELEYLQEQLLEKVDISWWAIIQI